MPKWLMLAIVGVIVFVSGVVFVCGRAMSFEGDEYERLVGGSALATFGLIFFLIGIFGTEFHNEGDDKMDPPADRTAGRALFIAVSLPFILAGLFAIFH